MVFLIKLISKYLKISNTTNKKCNFITIHSLIKKKKTFSKVSSINHCKHRAFKFGFFEDKIEKTLLGGKGLIGF